MEQSTIISVSSTNPSFNCKNVSDKLKEHSKHHSSKHMAMMKKDIKKGMSFSAAHKKAQKMVGK